MSVVGIMGRSSRRLSVVRQVGACVVDRSAARQLTTVNRQLTPDNRLQLTTNHDLRARMESKHTYCVIMAGGIGSRFWPMSRTAYPKQFLDFLGLGRTLIQQTWDRFLPLCPPENILVVTNTQYAPIVWQQLPGHPGREHPWTEPPQEHRTVRGLRQPRHQQA
jgi:hypothetical protein